MKKTVLTLAFVGCLMAQAIVAMALDESSTSGLGDQNYDVRRFLTEAPPLLRVVYGIDATTYHNVDEKKDAQPKTGFVYYEGAVQPTTFYRRIMEGMPGREYAGCPKGYTAGISSEGLCWLLDYGYDAGIITLSAKTEESSASRQAEESRHALQRVRALWINCLVPGTVSWIDTNHFQAKAESLSNVTGTNETEQIVFGEITAYDQQGRPTELEYYWPELQRRNANTKLKKTFVYSEPVGATALPNLIVTTSTLNNQNVSYTNNLKLVEIGLTSPGKQDYTAEMFLAPRVADTPPPYRVHDTNGVRFQLSDGGQWEKLPPSVALFPRSSERTPSSSVPSSPEYEPYLEQPLPLWRWIAIILVVGVLGCFLVLRFRRNHF